ncbi:MAG: hypothetical protein HZB42_05475 [Sphingobacteriales bacterium]|nr:hypothetical protein [Sphingobacteriales bacterium]
MKKIFAITTAFMSLILLTQCDPSKKIAETPPPTPKLTYNTNLSTAIMNNCTPCHIPAKGGRKKAYDTYAAVKTDIDEIIRRIELNPTDKGFMPFKGTAKLPDSTISIFKQWKTDGLLEN